MSCPRVFSLALLAIAVLAVGPMAAASGQPPIFATLKHSGWKPVRSFPVAPGVRGWVFRVHGVYHIGYVIDGGRELAAGPLIGIRGQNLTPAFRRRYAPHISRRKLWREVTRTRHLAGPGHKTRPLYVFFDPNCIFCHRLFVQSRRWAKRGLRIEWIPVAFLKASSAGRAASMLRAHDGYQTLVFDEQHFNAAQEEGGAMVSKVSRQDRKILQHNLSLMGQLGGMGTPTLVWRASNGRIKAKSGDPGSLAGLFRTLRKKIEKSG